MGETNPAKFPDHTYATMLAFTSGKMNVNNGALRCGYRLWPAGS